MQRLVQRLVAVRRDVAFDALGIHDAAVREHDGKLFGKKRRFRVGLRNVRLTAFERADNRWRVFGGDFDVERILGIHRDERAFAAELHAADAAHFDFVLQAGVRHGFFKLLLDAFGVGGHAAGGHAAAQDNFFPPGDFFFFDRDEIGENHFCIHWLICSSADSGVARGVTVPS